MYVITDEPIDVPYYYEKFSRNVLGTAGAITIFVGNVRRINRDRKVIGIYYECYREMAEASLGEIISYLKDKYGLTSILIVHRIGYVKAGENSLLILCASERRKESLEACSEAIELVKKKVPIWKKEIYENGEEWL